MKEFEKQKKMDDSDLADISAAEEQKKLERFINTEKNIVSSKNNQPGTSSSISNMANGKHKELPSFWMPSQLPGAKITKVVKPDKTIYCPVSGKPFKAKDLIDVKFTLVTDPDDKKSLIAKVNRYMCPIT